MSLPVPAAIGALSKGDAEAQVLIWCENGRAALQQARTLAEAQNLHAFASTLDHAVKLKNLNEEAAIAASSLIVWAKRCCGTFVIEEREAGTLADAKSGSAHLRSVPRVSGASTPPPVATLADHGISRNEASEMVRLAKSSVDVVEKAIDLVTKDKVRNVTPAAVLRKINPEAEKRPDERWLEADKFTTTAKRLIHLRDAATSAVSFGLYPGPEDDLVGAAVKRTLTSARDAITDVLRALERHERTTK